MPRPSGGWRSGCRPRRPRSADGHSGWPGSPAHPSSLPRPVLACARAAGSLPRDHHGPNATTSARDVRAALSAAQTARLLYEVPRAYRTQINDVLLTALGTVLTEWSRAASALVDVESHGREDLGPDIDVSRTVGWFTSFYPVVLAGVASDGDPGAALRRPRNTCGRSRAAGWVTDCCVTWLAPRSLRPRRSASTTSASPPPPPAPAVRPAAPPAARGGTSGRSAGRWARRGRRRDSVPTCWRSTPRSPPMAAWSWCGPTPGRFMTR